MQPYAEAFKCPLNFNAAFNELLFSNRDLALPLSTAAPALVDMHDQAAKLGLDRLVRSRMAQRAQEAIIKRLPEGTPRRAQIANDLNLSDRTFQRRLEEEGKSFSDLLDDTRRDLTQQYLGKKHLSIKEIVYLLGYNDQSNFFQACLRWFGQTPGKYRAQLGID